MAQVVPPVNPVVPALGNIINVPAGQNIQHVLNYHYRSKRLTDIPLFYAQPG